MELEQRKMQINGISIHKVNIADEIIEIQDVPKEEKDFHNYVYSIVSEVSRDVSGRRYKIRDTNTQVISSILQIISNNDFGISSTTAERLLLKEVEAQRKIARLQTEINEGILIQTLINDNDVKKFVICKAENSEFIENQKYKKSSGFPIKRKIFRSVQIIFDNENIKEIIINELNGKTVKYWWDDFLELNQELDDEFNTTQAFDRIDNKILLPIKKDFPADHTVLRNATIKYFRREGAFEIEDFISNVFDHVPESNALDLDSLKAKTRGLPDKFGFDKKFELVAKVITAKIKSIYSLTQDIDLVIKKDINLKNYINPIIFEGKKYLRIRTDDGYNAFPNIND